MYKVRIGRNNKGKLKKITATGAGSSAAEASGAGSAAGVSATLTSSAGTGTAAVTSGADIIAKNANVSCQQEQVSERDKRGLKDTNMKR